MGRKICTKCGQEKTTEEFGRRTISPDGLTTWCKSCLCQYGRERNRPTPFESTIFSRVCTRCEVDKPLSEFSPSPKGKFGHSSQCKECSTKIIQDRRRIHKGVYEGVTKSCSRCKRELPEEEFRSSGGIRNSWCRKCAQAHDQIRHSLPIASCGVATVRFHAAEVWRRKLGLTFDQIGALLDRGGGQCEICAAPLDSATKRTTPHLDHDHVTGKARGFLCSSCNAVLGLVADDPNTLRKAIHYLESQLESEGVPLSPEVPQSQQLRGDSSG